MNLRGKGSVFKAKIPLEWADVSQQGRFQPSAGVRGREERGVGAREKKTHVSICGNVSGPHQ